MELMWLLMMGLMAAEVEGWTTCYCRNSYGYGYSHADCCDCNVACQSGVSVVVLVIIIAVIIVLSCLFCPGCAWYERRNPVLLQPAQPGVVVVNPQPVQPQPYQPQPYQPQPYQPQQGQPNQIIVQQQPPYPAPV